MSKEPWPLGKNNNYSLWAIIKIHASISISVRLSSLLNNMLGTHGAILQRGKGATWSQLSPKQSYIHALVRRSFSTTGIWRTPLVKWKDHFAAMLCWLFCILNYIILVALCLKVLGKIMPYCIAWPFSLQACAVGHFAKIFIKNFILMQSQELP